MNTDAYTPSIPPQRMICLPRELSSTKADVHRLFALMGIAADVPRFTPRTSCSRVCHQISLALAQRYSGISHQPPDYHTTSSGTPESPSAAYENIFIVFPSYLALLTINCQLRATCLAQLGASEILGVLAMLSAGLALNVFHRVHSDSHVISPGTNAKCLGRT